MLKDMIDDLRDNLYVIIEDGEENKILMASQELDLLIVQYMRENIKSKAAYFG